MPDHRATQRAFVRRLARETGRHPIVILTLMLEPLRRERERAANDQAAVRQFGEAIRLAEEEIDLILRNRSPLSR